MKTNGLAALFAATAFVACGSRTPGSDVAAVLPAPTSCEEAKAGTVQLNAGREIGAGGVISPDGYILTVKHVADGGVAGTIYVTFADGGRAEAQRVFNGKNALLHPSLDLALIKVNPAGLNFRVLPFASASTPAAGAAVCTIGSPYGQPFVLTKGTFNRWDQVRHDWDMNLEAHPGNSGGPVVTADGKYLGAMRAIQSNNPMHSFAVDLPSIREFVKPYVSLSSSDSCRDAKLYSSQKAEGVQFQVSFAQGCNAEVVRIFARSASRERNAAAWVQIGTHPGDGAGAAMVPQLAVASAKARFFLTANEVEGLANEFKIVPVAGGASLPETYATFASEEAPEASCSDLKLFSSRKDDGVQFQVNLPQGCAAQTVRIFARGQGSGSWVQIALHPGDLHEGATVAELQVANAVSRFFLTNAELGGLAAELKVVPMADGVKLADEIRPL